MEDERLQVLRLVETGRITPEQAAALLSALAPPGRAATDRAAGPTELATSAGGYVLAADSAAEGPRWLRIRVSDPAGRSSADVQVPLSVVSVALRVGARFLPQLRALDPSWVIETMTQRGRAGRPVFTFNDAAGGDRVVVTVE